MSSEKTLSKSVFFKTLLKNYKILHKKYILNKRFYNFECFELILKVPFEDILSII